MTTPQSQNGADILKTLSSKDFQNFGMQDIAYVRETEIDGEPAYAIHAADGTQLSVMENVDAAVATLLHNNLAPVTLH